MRGVITWIEKIHFHRFAVDAVNWQFFRTTERQGKEPREQWRKVGTGEGVGVRCLSWELASELLCGVGERARKCLFQPRRLIRGLKLELTSQFPVFFPTEGGKIYWAQLLVTRTLLGLDCVHKDNVRMINLYEEWAENDLWTARNNGLPDYSQRIYSCTFF